MRSAGRVEGADRVDIVARDQYQQRGGMKRDDPAQFTDRIAKRGRSTDPRASTSTTARAAVDERLPRRPRLPSSRTITDHSAVRDPAPSQRSAGPCDDSTSNVVRASPPPALLISWPMPEP